MKMQASDHTRLYKLIKGHCVVSDAKICFRAKAFRLVGCWRTNTLKSRIESLEIDVQI